jgi:hypothetical protein
MILACDHRFVRDLENADLSEESMIGANLRSQVII